jgi:hypothetical protein
MGRYVADLTTTTGWTERWNTGKASVAVESGVGLRFTVSSDGSSDLYGLSYDAVDSDADRDDFEILAKVRFSAQYAYTSARTFGVFGRGSGTTTEVAYTAALLDAGGDGLDTGYIDRWNASFTSLISAGAYFSLTANTWYWIKFRVEGSALKFKIWADGANEPGWASGTDSTITAAGWIGLSIVNGLEIDPIDLGYFEVRTGADLANADTRLFWANNF